MAADRTSKATRTYDGVWSDNAPSLRECRIGTCARVLATVINLLESSPKVTVRSHFSGECAQVARLRPRRVMRIAMAGGWRLDVRPGFTDCQSQFLTGGGWT
jgi:hypothetical protein